MSSAGTTPPTRPPGLLPSEYPEAASLPAVRELCSQQIDMQFADLRVLLRLPEPTLAPHVGCNFTAAAMLLNLISGFSIWFFHTPYSGKIRKKEGRGLPHSGKRFKGFVRAYYPRQIGEPTLQTIANHLYDARNVLVHSLGVDDAKKKGAQRPRTLNIVKPDPALSWDDIAEFETYATPPFAGVTVRREGLTTWVRVDGLYWACGRMLRRALSDQPAHCEKTAARLLAELPFRPAAVDT